MASRWKILITSQGEVVYETSLLTGSAGDAVQLAGMLMTDPELTEATVTVEKEES
jgi:predicted Zn-dependent peptidase